MLFFSDLLSAPYTPLMASLETVTWSITIPISLTSSAAMAEAPVPKTNHVLMAHAVDLSMEQTQVLVAMAKHSVVQTARPTVMQKLPAGKTPILWARHVL